MDGNFWRQADEQSRENPVGSGSSGQQQQRQLPNKSTDGVFLDVETFIGDVVNAVTDLTFEGFNSMEEFLVQKLGIKNEEEGQALKRGVDSIYNKVQDNIDENLTRWESICKDRYFKDYPPTSLTAGSSEKITRDGSKSGSGAFCVQDEQEKMLDSELRSLGSQLVAAHREGAKMRRQVTLLEKQLVLRREILSNARMESFDADVLEEAMRSAYLLKDSILKASSSQEKTSCIQTQLQLLKVFFAEQSPQEQISALKVPFDLENGDPAIVSLLG